MSVVERDDSRESDENVCVEGEELFDEFGRAGKAVDVDVAVAQVCGAQYGKSVFIGFAEVQYERFSAFKAELHMAFEEFYLGGFCFGAVMLIEAEFSAGDALGVLQKFHHSCFVFGSLCFDVLRMDAVSGVDEWIFFTENASGFEVGGVACHMDKSFWALDFGCGCFFFGRAAFVCKAALLKRARSASKDSPAWRS